MEFFFWGLEVKPGESVKVSPGDNFQLHLSQGAFGEVEKDDQATMFVKVDDRKLSIGTLSTDKFPQVMLDLVFNQEFELSHTSKSSCVFFIGYSVFQQAEEPKDEEERGRKIAPAPKQNCIQTKEEPEGIAEEKEKKPEQVKIESESETDEDSDDESDESYSTLVPIPDHELCSYSSEEEEEEGLPKELSEVDDSPEEDDDEEEEGLPKKPETGKKRAAVIPLKAPASDKKAKVATLSDQNTGDKKWVKSPKPLSPLACKCCPKRIFKNEYALECHTKAKHNAGAK